MNKTKTERKHNRLNQCEKKKKTSRLKNSLEAILISSLCFKK